MDDGLRIIELAEALSSCGSTQVEEAANDVISALNVDEPDWGDAWDAAQNVHIRASNGGLQGYDKEVSELYDLVRKMWAA